MKVLFCQLCGCIVSPPQQDMQLRWCDCQRHAVWWLNGDKGIIRVYDKEGPSDEGPAPYNKKAWLLGISNSLLTAPEEWTEDPEFWETMAEQEPDAPSLFRRYGTCIVRFRPGETGDSAYAANLPS